MIVRQVPNGYFYKGLAYGVMFGMMFWVLVAFLAIYLPPREPPSVPIPPSGEIPHADIRLHAAPDE